MLLGLTLGFERTTYSFDEPSAGTSLTREDICITVSNGELGFSLVIVPEWTATTATGMCNVEIHCTCCIKALIDMYW